VRSGVLKEADLGPGLADLPSFGPYASSRNITDAACHVCVSSCLFRHCLETRIAMRMLSLTYSTSLFLFKRRFGFANPEALANGETGTACRGEEHDVTLVWSITSGKRLVLADGQEVHYSNSRNSFFDFSWTMRGNHVLKIVAHASPPLSPTPGFRQYDFFVDGRSFFTFPKVYRLGLSPGDPRAVPSPTSPTALAERGSRYRTYSSGPARSASGDNIASIEAPNNPDEVSRIFQLFLNCLATLTNVRMLA